MSVDEYPATTAYVAAALKTQVVIREPRCPNPRCNRMQANAVIFGDFTCPECKTHFIIGEGFVTIITEGTC